MATCNPSSNDIGLFDGFLNPLAFDQRHATHEQAAGAIIRGMTRQVGNEIDEFVTDALRNKLLGIPLDLAAHQHRPRPRHRHAALNAARAQFFAQTGDTLAEALHELGRLRAAT